MIAMQPALPPAATSAPAAAPVAATLSVESHGFRYTVAGNTLLAPDEVAAALRQGAAPAAAIGALKAAYARHGYFLVAVVARADGADVRVQVVQGRLVQTTGPEDLVRFFAPLEGDPSVRTRDVVRRNLLAQAYAATTGRQPQLAFTPASTPGGSQLAVTAIPQTDHRTASGSLGVGNLGNRYAGHDLAQLQGQLQGRGITLQATHARALTGLDADSRGAYYASTAANLSAVTPAGWFQLDASRTRYRLGRAFAPLNPGGSVRVFGGVATQLLSADEDRRWTLAEGWHRIGDRETVFNGAYALRDQRYDVFDVATQASWRFPGLGRRTATAQLSGAVKLGGLDGTRGFTGGLGQPAAHFAVYTAHAGLAQALARGYQVQLDLDAQATPDTLPSYEQWLLGGMNNLTAYLPGTVAGDRGYLGRLSVQSPDWRPGAFELRAAAFLEVGAARYRYVTPGSPVWQALGDAGGSLELGLPRYGVHATLAYAEPLATRHVPYAVRRQQRAHVFVSLRVDL